MRFGENIRTFIKIIVVFFRRNEILYIGILYKPTNRGSIFLNSVRLYDTFHMLLVLSVFLGI